MGNKYMKQRSTSLIISKLQIKTVILLPVRFPSATPHHCPAQKKKNKKNKPLAVPRIGKDVEKLSASPAGNVNLCNCFEKPEFSSKAKHTQVRSQQIRSQSIP